MNDLRLPCPSRLSPQALCFALLLLCAGLAGLTSAQQVALPANPSANIEEIEANDDFVFLSASDGIHGQELWAYDTRQRETRLVKDINPGQQASRPTVFRVWKEVLYFLADDGVHGEEIWRSDGSEAGTFLLCDVNPGPKKSEAQYFCGWNNWLCFAANDGTHDLEYWLTDGTSAGTRMLKDIHLPHEIGIAAPVEPLQNLALFRASPEGESGQLWRTDGTEEGTQRIAVKDLQINPFNYPSYSMGSYALIQGFLKETGNELWRSDGTVEGSFLLKDIQPGQKSSQIGQYVRYEDKAYFNADDGLHGKELWETDGTTDGTRLCKDLVPGSEGADPSPLRIVGGKIFFTAQDKLHGRELWCYDLSTTEATLLGDLAAGPASSAPYQITPFQDAVLFSAKSDLYGEELFFSDGTTNGTRLVKDIFPGTQSAEPYHYDVCRNRLYFLANDGRHGGELWCSDATTEGTVLLADIALPLPNNPSSSPQKLISSGDTNFIARAPDNLWHWWFSRGTGGSTQMLRPLDVHAQSPDDFIWLATTGSGSYLLLKTERGADLWFADGSDLEPRKVLSFSDPNFETGPPLRAQTILYFSIRLSNEVRIYAAAWEPRIIHSYFLKKNQNLALGLYSKPPLLWFSVPHEPHGDELWSFDGTKAVRQELGSLKEGGFLRDLTPSAEGLYFVADDETYGPEIWLLDKNKTSRRLTDINPLQNTGAPAPRDIHPSESGCYFVADDGVHGAELWRLIEGLPPVLVKDIFPGTASSNPSLLTGAGSRLFFRAESPEFGSELWISDGTGAGTRLVMDLNPGPSSSTPADLTSTSSALLFTAYDAPVTQDKVGPEWWVTDGEQVQRLGLRSEVWREPRNLAAGMQDGFSLAADDGFTGVELWRLVPRAGEFSFTTVLVKDIFPPRPVIPAPPGMP